MDDELKALGGCILAATAILAVLTLAVAVMTFPFMFVIWLWSLVF